MLKYCCLFAIQFAPRMKRVYFMLTCFIALQVSAQVTNTGLADTTDGERINNLSVGGYVDAYYGYSSGNQSGDVPYFVSMNRHKEMNVNLAFIDLRYSTSRLRARFIPGVGTYMNANYAGEQGSLKNIVEANAGVKLFEKRDIWVDFGVLGSPYTNESAISKDHLMYTRSLAAEFAPYYLSGLKVTLPISSKLCSYIYFINGWQQIKDANSAKSLGTQLEYRPTKKTLINWNTYFGLDSAYETNGTPGNRFFSDIYLIYKSGKKIDITSSIYIGTQKIERGNRHYYGYWQQANVILAYHFNAKTSLAGRVEYFKDKSEVFGSNLNMLGTGLCYNYKLLNNALFRLDFRQLRNEDNVYRREVGGYTQYNLWLVSGLTMWF